MTEFSLNVVAAANFETSQVRLIEVELRYNGQRRDVILDNERRSATVEFQAAEGPREVSYRFRAYVDSPSGEQRFESPMATTDAAVLVVLPSQLFRILPLMAVGAYDPKLYNLAFVDYRVGSAADAASVTLQVRPGEKDGYPLVVARDSASQLQVRTRYVTSAGELLEGSWQDGDGTTVVVANPAVPVSS